MRIKFFVAVSIAYLFATQAVAQSPIKTAGEVPDAMKAVPAKSKVKSARDRRSYASIDLLDSSTSKVTRPLPRRFITEPDYVFHTNILGGITQGTDTGPSPLTLGGSADVRIQKYLGIEIEGTGTLPTSKASTSNDISISQRTFTIGTMASVTGHYPLQLGSVKITPKLGAGYGMIHYEEVDTVTSPDALSNKVGLNSSGIFGTVGLDVSFSKDFEIQADYATSVVASGSTSQEDNSGIVRTGTLDGAKFSRIRAGAYYSLYPQIRIGGQFLSREVSGSAFSPISQKQILACIGFVF